MDILHTALPDVKIICPRVFRDNRGYFLEIYNRNRYLEPLDGAGAFVQDNISLSRKGIIRGLHLQNPNMQGKLVMVLSGTIFDVAVDVRLGSPTFGKYAAVELDARSYHQLWIPRGFAHGFLVRSEEACVYYKCDAPYSSDSEVSIRWDDPTIGIDWGADQPLLSDKDAKAPLLRDAQSLPSY